MTTNQTPAKVPNLRETRKAMAAAKRRHPAGKAPAKAPAKAVTVTPKAAPKAVTVTDKPARATLRWQFPNGKDEFKDGKTQYADFDGGQLGIERSGDAWRAVYKVGKKETLLAEGTFGKCYNACTRHAKGAAA